MTNIYLLIFVTLSFAAHCNEAKPVTDQLADPLFNSDSTLADSYKSKADSLFKSSQYDSSLIYYDKAAVIYKEQENWENYIYCYYEHGNCLFRKGEYESAVKIFKDCKALILEKLNEKHIIMIQVLNGLGNSYYRLGDYKKAREYLNKAVMLSEDLEISDYNGASDVISYLYNSLGILEFETGNYPEAKDNFSLSLNYTNEPLNKGRTLSNLAIVYSITGYFDKAIDYYEKALKFYYSIPKISKFNIASLYSNMSIALSERKGDYDEALLYQDKALSMFLELYGEAHDNVAIGYYNKGDYLLKKGNLDLALFNFNKALNVFRSVYQTEKHTDVAMSYNSIGEVYERLSNYKKAYEYYEKALSIRLNIFGERHVNVAKGYNNIGSIERIQKNYTDAAEYHEQALAILKNIFGERHPEIAETYNLLGLTYRETGKYDIALKQFQNAIKANVPSFSDGNFNVNPKLDDIISGPKLLETLSYKAETLTKWHKENKDAGTLKTAFDTYRTISELIDKMRTGHQAEGSKLFLAEKSSETIEEAIETSVQLYNLTGENKYKEAAYFFCERSKARILQEAMNESEARNFSGIPDSLLVKENQLKTDLTFYQNMLQEEKYRKEDIDSLKMNDFENRIFSLNWEYQHLIQDLEINYPKYYKSKYPSKPVEIKNVQNSLAENETLLEYFTGSETIYLFYFSAEDYELIKIDIDKSFQDLVAGFYRSIKKIDMKGLLQYARELYNIIIKPVEHFIADKEKLIIIPDGQLYYIPFESLITKPGENLIFSQQNYLINKYDISYHYSISFIVDKSINFSGDVNNKGLIGFAPVFNNSTYAEKLLLKNTRSDDLPQLDFNEYRFITDNNEIRDLPYSEEELKYIIKLFKDKNKPAAGYFYDSATKETLKAEAGNYKYIHLATHSFVNPEKPRFSGILLAKPEDSAYSNGILYANEIYNLDLNADLVILSSCESGIGKLVRGEGIMALTRGFLYAGADNIIISLWKVYDKSTALLMKSFYRNVFKNKTYSEALRQAKLDMIQNNATSFPANWSGFIIIGK
jgi:CHAT domain-containing protein/tetratricopeptide (TPR) repeat protein